MRGKRHGAMGAALALLTLLAALFCALSVRSEAPVVPVVSASFAEEGPSAVTAVSSVVLPALDTDDQDTNAAVDGPCLKKVVPEQPQPRNGAALISGLPTETSGTAWAHGSAHTVTRHRDPAPSPPDLTELSVRRV